MNREEVFMKKIEKERKKKKQSYEKPQMKDLHLSEDDKYHFQESLPLECGAGCSCTG